MKEQKFRKLDVWKKAIELIGDIYDITKTFPSAEMYGLTSQMRRACTSIALNIAEGSGAGSDADFKRFLNISLRSSYETMCAIEIAHNLNFIESQNKDILLRKCDELSAMIGGFIKRLKADS